MDSTTLTLDNEASGNVYAGTISTTSNGQAYFGDYSWGKIILGPRLAANSYTIMVTKDLRVFLLVTWYSEDLS